MLRVLLIILTIALILSLPSDVDLSEAIAQEWVVVDHGDRLVHSYLARPQGVEPTAAVVLIHEIFGLSDWVLGVADRLAAEGYVAIAPDLLSGMGPDGGRTPDFADRSAVTRAVSNLPSEQVTADLQAVAARVSQLEGVNGLVAVAGFCWGGSETFRFASAQPGLAAAFVFYGTGSNDQAAIARIDAPVYGFYGGNDARVTSTVPTTTDLMKEASKFYEPVTYEEAGHGFMRSGEESGAAAANSTAFEQAWTRWLGILMDISPPVPAAVEATSWGQIKAP